MDKITKKFNNNKKLYNSYTEYFDKFSSVIGSYYSEEIKTLKKIISDFSDLLETIKKIKVEKIGSDVEHSFILVHYLTHLDILSKKIKNKFIYFNPGKHRFNQEFSTTYLMETSAMFDKILIIINNTLKKHDRYDTEIIPFIGNKIVDSMDFSKVLVSFEETRKIYKKYRNSISLYAYISQKIIDKLFAGDKESRRKSFQILALLEDDKNNELQQGQLKKKYDCKAHNPPIKSFGMIPKTSFMTLNEIIKSAFNQTISVESKESVLDKLGKANNLTIVVHTKITTRDAEYILKNIFSKSNDKHTTGINKELVEKFKTINIGKVYSPYKFQFNVYGKSLDSNNKMLLIECIAKQRYRIMTPYSSPSYYIDKKTASDFVNYVRDKTIKRPTRSENYNRIMQNKMMQNMFLGRAMNIKTMSEQSQVTEIKFLRNTVYTSLLEHYVKVMDKDYNEGKNIKSNKDLIKIINNDDIKDIFQEILVKNYYSFLKKNNFLDENTSFLFTEVLSTFLANLQIITRGFVREIYSNSENFKPPESLFKQPYPVMYAEIRDIFDKILKATLSKIMEDKSNIYQSLMFKTMIIDI